MNTVYRLCVYVLVTISFNGPMGYISVGYVCLKLTVFVLISIIRPTHNYKSNPRCT